jgi:GNAT superfamily N-acetyltransferase
VTVASIEGSHRVLGLYRGSEQVGFARAISDGATFAYLADLPACRGRGLGLELVRELVDGGPSRALRWALNTADAQPLYAKLGFTARAPRYPLMERSGLARETRRRARADADPAAPARGPAGGEERG